MQIVKPYAKIISIKNREEGIDLLKKIEWAARISHRSEDKQTESSWERFVRAVVLRHGDWSVTEHAGVTVDTLTDRGVTHEIVRHRLLSPTQQSTRFVNHETGMPPTFIYPIPGVECLRCEKWGDEPYLCYDEDQKTRMHHVRHYGTSNIEKQEACPYDPDWMEAIHRSEDAYKTLIKKGWRPQEARSVFPTGLASRIVITANLRNWRCVFMQRVTKEAHPQMRQIMIPLLAEFQEKIPILFDDIIPDQQQAVSMRNMR